MPPCPEAFAAFSGYPLPPQSNIPRFVTCFPVEQFAITAVCVPTIGRTIRLDLPEPLIVKAGERVRVTWQPGEAPVIEK
jgi:hypothetical protein